MLDSILNGLYTAVSWVLVTFHDLLAFTNNTDLQWVVGIIALVILIRIILIPLFVKQIKSQRALTALQPHMKVIQKKYKDDRQKQSEEMMKLYKEHKTNPFASCFPILAQAPIFFALFWVLNSISQNQPRGLLKGEYLISAREASFFGAPLSGTFLGSSEFSTKAIAIVLIIFMSATTFTTHIHVQHFSRSDRNCALRFAARTTNTCSASCSTRTKCINKDLVDVHWNGKGLYGAC